MKRIFRTLIPLLTWASLGVAGVLGQVKDYHEIKYPPLPEFKIPAPTVYSLGNGMQIFLLEDHELPLVEVTARIRTGSNYEPADKVGLASLTGVVQRSGGTTGLTGDQIDDFLAARAASIETGIGADSGSASLNCLKQDFDDVFRIFVDILRTPAFAQDKLEVAKVAENTAIARRNDEVGEIAEREITRLVYGTESPLARNVEYATINAITRQDLIAWHQKYYQPNDILLGVVGDFNSNEMKQKLEAAFRSWPRGPVFTAPAVPYKTQPVPGYYLIEKVDVNQANIVFGQLGIEMSNPDYFAIQVMNEILGGGFASRLFSNVRSKKGLAYSVFGAVGSDYNQPGLFRAGLQTKSATTVQAIQAVKAELVRLLETPPSETELKRAKDTILNAFIFNYDSKVKILSQQMTYAFYGLAPDFLEQYRARIEQVGEEDVTRVSRRYVHPDQLAILVVGKSAEFGESLTNLGKVTPLDITIPPPAEAGPKVEKSAASLEEGKRVWASVVKAMGGPALKKTVALQSTARLLIKSGEQSLSLTQHTTLVFPDKVRQAITSPAGEQTVVINGADGFILTSGKLQPLPPSTLEEQAKDQKRILQFLLRYHDDPALEIVAAGREMIEGMSCRVLAVSDKGVDCRLWVAPDGKVAKQSYQGTNPLTRAPGLVENLYSDYRSEGALMIPHRQTKRVDGQDAMEIIIESFRVNPRLEAALFQKPQ